MLHQCTMQAQLGNLLLATASKLLLWGLKGAAVSWCPCSASDWGSWISRHIWIQQDRQSPDLGSEIFFLHHKECREPPSSLWGKNQWMRGKIISNHHSVSDIPLLYKIFCFDSQSMLCFFVSQLKIQARQNDYLIFMVALVRHHMAVS